MGSKDELVMRLRSATAAGRLAPSEVEQILDILIADGALAIASADNAQIEGAEIPEEEPPPPPPLPPPEDEPPPEPEPEEEIHEAEPEEEEAQEHVRPKRRAATTSRKHARRK